MKAGTAKFALAAGAYAGKKPPTRFFKLPRGAEDLRDVFELLREMERAGTIRVVSYDEAFSARN